MRLGLSLLVVLVVCFQGSVSSAELFFQRVAENTYAIQMKGEIVEGDYSRLLTLIESSPVTFLGAPSFRMSSSGGSVNEAILIGNLVEQASIMVEIPEGEICASSCFLIYVSAPMRSAYGDLLIHRPYLTAESYKIEDAADTGEIHQLVMKETREFLELKAVSPTLIDKMMSLPSNDAYKLQDDDLLQLGFMSPFFEEASIAKCGFSEKDLFNMDRVDPAAVGCVNGMKDVSRAKLLEKILGPEAAREAIRTYLLSRGGVEGPDGRITGTK